MGGDGERQVPLAEALTSHKDMFLAGHTSSFGNILAALTSLAFPHRFPKGFVVLPQLRWRRA